MKLSIIIPVYNVENYLDECLNSILKNKPNNVEIITVNDGSNDRSREILSKYKEKILILDKENGGLSSARNYGAEYASGEYIYFLDSDDLVSEDFYLKTMPLLISKKIDIFLFSAITFNDGDDARLFDNNKYLRHTDGYMSAIDYFTNAVSRRKYFVQACMYIFKREKYNRINFINGILHEDNPFTTAILNLDPCAKAYICKDSLYLRRMREGSIMKTVVKKRNFIGYFSGCEYLVEFKKEYNINVKEFDYFVNHLFHASMLALYKSNCEISNQEKKDIKLFVKKNNLNLLSKILALYPNLFFFYGFLKK